MDSVLVSTPKDTEENLKTTVPYMESKHYTHPILFDDLNKMCFSILEFVNSEPNDRTNAYKKNESHSWCTSPIVLYKALISQEERAISRYRCLKNLLEQLSLKYKSPTILGCVQQQLLEGCFGFCSIKSEDNMTQMHHYLDSIQAAPLAMQEKIRVVVHGIYENLIKTLKGLLATNSDNKYLILVIIFTLSSKYESSDLTNIINNDLVQLLMQLISINTISTKLVTKNEFLSVAALRLIQVITMCCCIHSKRVDLDTLENVLNILHEQFIKAMEVFDESSQNYSHLTYTENYTTDGERHLGDFLLFLRTISSSVIIQKLLASKKWIYAFLTILETTNACTSYPSQMKILRPKLLVIQLLQIILPGLQSVHIDDDLRKHIVNKLINQISKEMWNECTNAIQSPINENIIDDVDGELLDNYKSKGNILCRLLFF